MGLKKSELPVRMYLSGEAPVRIAVRKAAVQRSIAVRIPAIRTASLTCVGAQLAGL